MRLAPSRRPGIGSPDKMPTPALAHWPSGTRRRVSRERITQITPSAGGRLSVAAAGTISRKRIAAYLYGDQGWSMQRIGEAPRVSKSQISRDLDTSHFPSGEMSPSPRTDTLGRKAPPGRLLGRYIKRGPHEAARK
jgi:hypothetical protein